MPSFIRFQHRFCQGSEDFVMQRRIWVRNDSLAVQTVQGGNVMGLKDETIL